MGSDSSQESNSSVELLDMEILDSEDDGGDDPVSQEAIRRKRQKMMTGKIVVPRHGLKEGMLTELASTTTLEEKITTMNSSSMEKNTTPETESSDDEVELLRQDEFKPKAKEEKEEPSIRRESTVKTSVEEPQLPVRLTVRQPPTKRPSLLSDHTARTTPRFRTGLSKRVKISPLHPNLARKP